MTDDRDHGHLVSMEWMMNIGHRTVACGLAFWTVACGVKSVGGLDESSSTDGGSDTAGDLSGSASLSASATSVTEPSSSDVDTGNPTEPTSSDVDTGNPTEPTGDTGCLPDDAMCDPAREVESDAAAWTLSGFREFSEELVEVTCTLDDIDDVGPTLTLTLHCDEGEPSEHVLVVPTNPTTSFTGTLGMSVTLSHQSDPIFWVNRWFAMRDVEGRLLLGGAEGSEVLPPSGNAMFLPLELTADPTACPSFEPCDRLSCSTARRQAIDVLLDVESAKVFDGTVGSIIGEQHFTLLVGRAEELLMSDTCEDVPPAWYNFVIYDSTVN